MPPNAISKPEQASLSREGIARAALHLADAQGIDALSMRRLAERLGVGTMTLYGYFRSKDQLLDAVVDVASADIDLEPGDGPWKEQLRVLMRRVRQALAEHPVGVELRARRPMLTPAALRITEAGMRILQAAGFDQTQAAMGYRSLFLYTFGFATFSSPADPEAVKRRGRAILASLTPEEFPALVGAGPELIEVLAGEDQFELGLSVLLDGLEARLA